jgi:flagellar hook protein FlgE
MGFQQGLSGLNASSKALEAIGNNVSNSGTVGFKSGAAQFADVYAASLTGTGTNQIGIGTSVQAVAQQFTQGNITTTNNPLDIAINGSGFFRMQSTSGAVSYTRNGQFQVDKNGYVINSAGSQLTGYLANTNGIIVPATPQAIHIDTSDLQPVATGQGTPATGLVVGLNLDSRKTPPSASIAATATGVSAPDLTTLAGAPATFDVTINGYNTGTLTIPQGSYTATSLASTVQTLINAALPSGTSVTVAPNTSGSLVFTAVPGGTGSSIAVNDTSNILFNSQGVVQSLVTATGAPNLNSLADPNIGGTSVDITVDGTTVTVSIPTNTYTNKSLATYIQTEANNQLSAAGSTSTVSVSAGSAGTLVFQGSPSGSGHSISVAADSSNVLGLTTTTGPELGADAFSISDPLSYTSSTSATVYDSLGNPHTLGIYFVKAATPNQYNVYTNLDGGTPTAAKTVNFSTTGAPNPVAAFKIDQSFVVTTGGTSTLDFSLDLSKTTQYGSIFGVNTITQDGYASGRLSGLSIASDGTIQGKYSNGQTRNLAQVVLATFKNANGLQSLGGNQWQETATSGQPLIGTPGSGVNGVLQSQAVEESNTDLTAELVNMITQQRAYQANAQTIKTEDQILQTLVNLR